MALTCTSVICAAGLFAWWLYLRHKEVMAGKRKPSYSSALNTYQAICEEYRKDAEVKRP